MKELREVLREQILHTKRANDIEVYADVDAVNMM